jgi:hypothetical protein
MKKKTTVRDGLRGTDCTNPNGYYPKLTAWSEAKYSDFTIAIGLVVRI